MTDQEREDGTILRDRQNGCARCHGDGHDDLLFRPFTIPFTLETIGGEAVATHWSICPTTLEPILLFEIP